MSYPTFAFYSFVCPSVSLSVSRITKKMLTNFDEIFWRGAVCD